MNSFGEGLLFGGFIVGLIIALLTITHIAGINEAENLFRLSCEKHNTVEIDGEYYSCSKLEQTK